MDYNEPTPQPEPTEEFVSARARRRRAQRRAYFPADEEGRAALFSHLARRAFPSYELFVFSLVAGIIISAGYFFNSQALLVFGVLVAPVLTPWVGISLALIGGSPRFFAQTFSAMLISALLVFASGALTGFATRILPSTAHTFNEAFIHSRLWAADLAVLTIGAIIITISFVRSEERPYLPSALVAYEFFLPLCAAGFGLGSGIGAGEIWTPGLFVFFSHFAWATFFVIITLFFLRFYPSDLSGTLFTGLALLILLAALTVLTGFWQWIQIRTGLSSPEPVSTIQATSTLALAPLSPQTDSVTGTISPAPSVAIGVPSVTPSRTLRPTQTSTSQATATSTITAEPTPIIGLVRAVEGGGANIREKPGGVVLKTVGNGTTLTIVPNDIQDVNGVIWVHVIAIVNDERWEGWMLQSVIATATPIADWQPSPTPTSTPTP